MRRLRLGFVLGGLLVLAGAGRIGDSTTAAETSAGPPLATAAWAPSMKVVQFTPRGPDAPIDPGANLAEEPFAGSSPSSSPAAASTAGSVAPRAAAAEKALTAGAHKGLLCSDCHASSDVPSAQGSERPALKWSTRYDAAVPLFRVYSSKTFDASGTDISQPDGSSRVCVGCHASNDKIKRPENKIGADDMALSHPVSFTYNGGLAMRARRAGLKDPAMTPSGLGSTIAKDLLDANGKMQCTSCHDAHGAGPGPKLMRFQYDKTTSAGSNVCRICHNK